MRGTLATTTGYRSPPPSRSVTPVAQSPRWGRLREGTRPMGARAPAQRPPFLPPLPPEAFANSVEGEERRPLALGRGGGAESYALSRWERVGVRAGGGGGRASLLKPARRVTQRSPLGETERGRRYTTGITATPSLTSTCVPNASQRCTTASSTRRSISLPGSARSGRPDCAREPSLISPG